MTTSASGTLLGTIKYTPFGETRSVTGFNTRAGVDFRLSGESALPT